MLHFGTHGNLSHIPTDLGNVPAPKVWSKCPTSSWKMFISVLSMSSVHFRRENNFCVKSSSGPCSFELGRARKFIFKSSQNTPLGASTTQKSVQSLWEEIQLEESTINQEGQRLVRVVVAKLDDKSVAIRFMGSNKLLPMVASVFGPKDPWQRRSLAMKLPIGRFSGARRRAFDGRGDYSILTPEPQVSRATRMSGSYPGVMSLYERHIYQILAPNLPVDDFTIVEPDGLRSATWGWRETVPGNKGSPRVP